MIRKANVIVLWSNNVEKSEDCDMESGILLGFERVGLVIREGKNDIWI